MRDRLEYRTRDSALTVVLTGFSGLCTRCNAWKPAFAFGLREMPDGTIRNQPQCSPCRGLQPVKDQ